MSSDATITSNATAELLLTLGMAWLSVLVVTYLYETQTSLLVEFFGILLLLVVLIPLSKLGFCWFGRRTGTAKALAKPRNLRKFGDQGWQLMVHAGTSIFEAYVLSQDGDWQYMRNPAMMATQPVSSHPLTKHVYVIQIAIWFYTAYSHRFLEAKHKDYLMMFVHHFITSLLCYMSLVWNFTSVGLVVLFIHDISDIPIDLAKMANYMGWDSSSGLFIVEYTFVTSLISWAYFRLYLFPMNVLYVLFFIMTIGDADTDTCLDEFRWQCNTMRYALLVLLIMHIFWFGLMSRILVKIVTGSNAHAAGGEEYEGTSDSDTGRAMAASEAKKER